MGVYKVHTSGISYVLMGYTGKHSKERRTQNVQVEEAYKVISVGLEMLNVLASEREGNPNSSELGGLGLRVGIHTGRIVGGIIGTKFVRYEIFSQDVLITKTIMENSSPGTVSISEPTNQLILKSPFVSDVFAIEERCEVEAYDKAYQTYAIESIMISGDEGLSSGTEEEEGGSGSGSYVDG